LNNKNLFGLTYGLTQYGDGSTGCPSRQRHISKEGYKMR